MIKSTMNGFLFTSLSNIYTLIIFSVLFQQVLTAGISQSNSSESVILNAKKLMFRASNEADRELFLQAKDMIKPLIHDVRYTALVEYYLGYIDYRIGTILLRFDEDRASAYLDSAVEYLEMAIEKNNRFAEAYALLANCYGIKISFSPIMGIVYGPKSGNLLSKAKELSPNNPRIALIEGISIYNTPTIFGGGKEKGLRMMQRAAELFNQWKEMDPLQPDWGNEEVFAWIGIAQTKLKNYIEARRAFERSLEINPEFGWVKNHLLPQLLKKMETHQ